MKSSFSTTTIKFVLIFVLALVVKQSAFAQFGFATPSYGGKDKELFKLKVSVQLQTFLPLTFLLNSKESLHRSKANWPTIYKLQFRPGIKWDWYYFNDYMVASRDNGYTTLVEATEPRTLTKKCSSMMQSTNFFMPVSLLITPKGMGHITIAPGFYVEYLSGGKFQRKYHINQDVYAYKVKFKSDEDFFGFQRFQYGPCAYFSYKFVTVYGMVSMRELFKPQEGPEVRKYNVGIWFNLFWKTTKLIPF